MWGALSATAPSPPAPAKISASLDAAIVGHHMAMAGRVFPAGEGLVKDGIEATIQSIGPHGPGGHAGYGH